MLTKLAFGLAIITLATVSGSLAATPTHDPVSFSQTVYNPNGAYVGTNQGIRFELSRDGYRAHTN